MYVPTHLNLTFPKQRLEPLVYNLIRFDFLYVDVRIKIIDVIKAMPLRQKEYLSFQQGSVYFDGENAL